MFQIFFIEVAVYFWYLELTFQVYLKPPRHVCKLYILYGLTENLVESRG